MGNKRHVNYFGEVLCVPKWAGWLAMGSNKKIYAYAAPPVPKRTGDITGFWVAERACPFIGISTTLNCDDDEWYFSCVKINSQEEKK